MHLLGLGLGTGREPGRGRSHKRNQPLGLSIRGTGGKRGTGKGTEGEQGNRPPGVPNRGTQGNRWGTGEQGQGNRKVSQLGEQGVSNDKRTLKCLSSS